MYSAGSTNKINAYEAGMNWQISKPIEINELMSALTDSLYDRVVSRT